MPSLKQTLTDDMKAAMRAKQKERLATIRLILSEVKQVEVDERIEVEDTRLLSILDKMAKQRRESITQFEQADRQDLAQKEQQELTIISEFLPEPLSESEVDTLIQQAVTDTQAASIKDMGKVMAQLKPVLQGRADMSVVGQKVKQHLN